MLKKYKEMTLRLYPNKEQAEKIRRDYDAFRFMYNKVLEIHIYNKENKLPYLSRYSAAALIPKFTKETYPWLREGSYFALRSAVNILDLNYRSFFKRGYGFPRFLSKNKPIKSFGYSKGISIRNDHKHVYLPKIGEVRFRGYNPNVEGEFRGGMIKITLDNKYYLILHILCQVIPDRKPKNIMCGIDVGIHKYLVDSDGNGVRRWRFDALTNKINKCNSVFQKKIRAFKESGNSVESNNLTRTRIKLQNLNIKLKNKRRYLIEHISKYYTNKYRNIYLEDMTTHDLCRTKRKSAKIKNPYGKYSAILNNQMFNHSFGLLKRKLEQRSTETATKIWYVPTKDTSRMCSNCGNVDPLNRNSRRFASFQCTKCGYKIDPDYNAAINILYNGVMKHGFIKLDNDKGRNTAVLKKVKFNKLTLAC